MSGLVGKDLTRVFGTGHAKVVAVRDVNIAVNPGEVVLLIGPSGSGKTTLLSMLGGLLHPTSGSVQIGGATLDARDPRAPGMRLKSIGFVFQSFNLLPAFSVLDNVAMPLRLLGLPAAEARVRAIDLLKELGMELRANNMPETLSGGEKQRTSIARALAANPQILLADEPTANLDTQHGQEAIELLTSLSRQGSQGCLIVTHDTRLSRYADRVLTIEDGHLTSG